MKKILFPIICAVLTLALSACAKDIEERSAGNGRRVVLTGTNVSPGTRTSFGDVDGDAIPFLWSEGDRVWVNGERSGEATASGFSSDFVFDNLTGDAPFGVYYNMTGEVQDRVTIPLLQKQTGAYNPEFASNGAFGYCQSDRDGNFAMEHMASYIWFDPYSPDLDYDFTAVRFEASGVDIVGTASFTGGQLGTIEDGSDVLAFRLLGGNTPLRTEPDADKVYAAAVVFPRDLSGTTVKITYTLYDPGSMTQYDYTETLPGVELMPGQTYRISTEITGEKLTSIVLYRADGGEWTDDLPQGFTKLAVKTEQSGVLTEEIHAAISDAMAAGAEIDLSQADNHSETFGNYYANNNRLRSMALPRNITATADGTRGHATTHDGVFGKCTALETVVLPDGLLSLGYVTFYGCTSLKNIEIPASVTEVRAWAFYGCSGLEEIVLPDNVDTLEGNTFYQCTSLRSLTLPANLSSMGSAEFYGCKSLERLEIPSGVKEIHNAGTSGGGVFAGCESLVELVLHEGLESIGGNAFYNCRSLQELILPSTVKSIGQHTFYEPRALRRASLDTETVGNYSFWVTSGQSALEEITFGSRVTTIGTNAFMNSRNLGTIIFESAVCPTIATNNTFGSAGSARAAEDRKIFIPEGSLASYTANRVISYLTGTLGFTIIEGEEGAELPEGVYYSQTGFDGDWVTTYSGFTGNYIYAKTTGNAVLTAGELSGIEDFVTASARLMVVDLSQADYESTVTPDDLFGGNYGNPYLFELWFPRNVEEIGKQTAVYCSELRALFLGENVKVIREYVGGPPISNDKRVAVVCRAATPPALRTDNYGFGWPFMGFMPGGSLPCYVPDASVSAYTTDGGWTNILGSVQVKPLSELTSYPWRAEL